MRIVYGHHAIEAILDVRPGDVKRIVVGGDHPLADRARKAGIRVENMPKDRLGDLAKTQHHQGIVAEAADFPYAKLEDVLDPGPALVLVLDSIQDPQNLGALIRSAECLGATGVVIAQDRAAEVTGSAAKASAGAVERLPVAMVVNISRALKELKDAGTWVTGLAGEADSRPLEDLDFKGPSVLVVGAEGEGLRPNIRKGCDFLARIEMPGKTESLNASVAGALALYVASRQRRA